MQHNHGYHEKTKKQPPSFWVNFIWVQFCIIILFMAWFNMDGLGHLNEINKQNEQMQICVNRAAVDLSQHVRFIEEVLVYGRFYRSCPVVDSAISGSNVFCGADY